MDLYDPDIIDDALAFLGTAARWIMKLHRTRSAPTGHLPMMPEHFVEDFATIAVHIGRFKLELFQTAPQPMEWIMECVVTLLADAWLVHSPHLRAKLGNLIYEVLPY